MRRLLDFIDRLSLTAAWFGGFLLLAMTALILVEILARWLGGISLSFAWEYAVYSMGVAMFLGLGYALRSGAHIRVSLLFLLPHGARRTSELISTVAAIAISAFATYALFGLALSSFQSHTRSFTTSEVPLAIPQLGFAVGAFLLTLQFIARAIRVLRGEATEHEQQPTEG